MSLYYIEFRGLEPIMVKIEENKKVNKKEVKNKIQELKNDIEKLQIKLNELKNSIKE